MDKDHNDDFFIPWKFEYFWIKKKEKKWPKITHRHTHKWLKQLICCWSMSLHSMSKNSFMWFVAVFTKAYVWPLYSTWGYLDGKHFVRRDNVITHMSQLNMRRYYFFVNFRFHAPRTIWINISHTHTCIWNSKEIFHFWNNL